VEKYICKTCGTQYPPSNQKPERCVICTEERQYVHPRGQKWTTLKKMYESGTYTNCFTNEQKGLKSITTDPPFGIGQTAYLVEEQGFRLLWDCISYLDTETIEVLSLDGGIDAIALSHPHYYSTQVEWAETFQCPIYIHEDDRQWVQRPSDQIIFWKGESLEINKGLVLHRLGGHFKGGAVLHWVNENENPGVLLTGDIIQVVSDNKWVSFMYSYPNLIPLPAKKVEDMANTVKPLKFNQLFNAFHKEIPDSADIAVQRSAARYISALKGDLFNT
jgi:glyoxylase-like metal-dependent hydrolase (beta-lactamase superfamily II)